MICFRSSSSSRYAKQLDERSLCWPVPGQHHSGKTEYGLAWWWGHHFAPNCWNQHRICSEYASFVCSSMTLSLEYTASCGSYTTTKYAFWRYQDNIMPPSVFTVWHANRTLLGYHSFLHGQNLQLCQFWPAHFYTSPLCLIVYTQSDDKYVW